MSASVKIYGQTAKPLVPTISKASDAALTEQYSLVKVGSASDRVALCGAADTPLGVAQSTTSGAGAAVEVALLDGSVLQMVASGAISQGALVEPAASGRIQTLGGGVGVHHVVGRALDAAAGAGSVINVAAFYFIREI
jgi:hypothetical protein